MAFYRMTAQGQIETDLEIFEFTLHLQAASGHASDIVTTAQEALTLLWSGPPTPASSIQQLVPIGTSITGVLVDELDSAGRNVEQSFGSLSLAGTSINESLPPNVSVAVSTRTALPTRRGRGRFFLPPFAVDTVVSGLLDATPRGQVAAAAKAMLDHLNAGGWQVVIYHRDLNSGDNVIAVDCGNVFDQQERRRDKIVETRTRLTLA